MIADKMMTVTIAVEFNAFEIEGDKESRISELFEQTFGIDEDPPFVAAQLRDVAKAIERGRLYGWMKQEMMNSAANGGDIRPETPEEMLERWRSAHLQPDSANSP